MVFKADLGRKSRKRLLIRTGGNYNPYIVDGSFTLEPQKGKYRVHE